MESPRVLEFRVWGIGSTITAMIIEAAATCNDCILPLLPGIVARVKIRIETQSHI